MRRPRWLSMLLAGLVAVGLVLLVRGSHSPASEHPGATIGAVYNLTGSQAALDLPSDRGARLAIEQVNQQGGVLGQPVQVVVVDGESSLETVAQKTTQILERFPSVSALMGLSDTDMVLAAAPVAAAAQRVFLTSGATSPSCPAKCPSISSWPVLGITFRLRQGPSDL